MQVRYYQSECKAAIFDYYAKGGIDDVLCCLPTGTGKSFVIADFIKTVMQAWPNQRMMMLTHVKELIENNAKTLQAIWPSAPLGIFSAGLKRKDKHWPVTFAGVASIVKVIEEFGHIDILLIDECHLLSDKQNSMYGFIIAELRKINLNLKVIGFTATPYRAGMGLLTNGGIFKTIVFDITGYKAFNKLIEEGFLSPPVSKRTTTKLDLKNVGISNGDFSLTQLEHAIDKQDVNYLACKEMVEYGFDRVAWLVFAAGLKHAEHIATMLNSFGISSIAVHSKMSNEARDSAIKDFKAGKIRCLVNNNVLTTGFDHPPIDFIGMLRPTMSTGLWVQMLGRGTRPSPETMKHNCLCLDFARNTVRLGPINDPVIPNPKGAGASGTPPIKICDQCGTYNHATARFCENCGYEFPQFINITKTAGTEELLRSDMPQIEWFDVQRVVYGPFRSQAGENYLKTSYVVRGHKKAFEEIIALEKGGYPGKRAKDWWCNRMGSTMAPPTVEEALKWTSQLQTPKRIQVHVNKQYPSITGVEF